MSPIKTAVNATHTKSWLEPIGMLVVNFGAIELQTYLWLSDFAEDKQLPFKALKWRLSAVPKKSYHCSIAAWQLKISSGAVPPLGATPWKLRSEEMPSFTTLLFSGGPLAKRLGRQTSSALLTLVVSPLLLNFLSDWLPARTSLTSLMAQHDWRRILLRCVLNARIDGHNYAEHLRCLTMRWSGFDPIWLTLWPN